MPNRFTRPGTSRVDVVIDALGINLFGRHRQAILRDALPPRDDRRRDRRRRMRYFQAMAGSDAQMQRLIAGWQALSRNEAGSAEQIAKALLRRGARDAEFLVNAANLLAVSLM